MADMIARLKIDSSEYDSKVKRAAEGILRLERTIRDAGESFLATWKDEQNFARSLGQMETVSKTARGRISELSAAFTDLSVTYRHMTDEEKNSPFGKALAQSLEQLKGRVRDAKAELASINQELNGDRINTGKFGEFGNVLDTLGKKMGVTGNITEMLTSKTALMYAGIGAGIAIVGKATDAWTSYNKELAKQDQITTVTTGLKDQSAEHMTDTMRALSDTYKVDFREAVNAANTIMSQFGETGDAAIQMIKDGMQGMIQGDGPKLLSMIQQYAPAFRDAGVSASQLVAVIQNSEGGLFTDQNMNAIVMGIKNIRLMTKQTSDALAQLGIDGKQMSQQLNEGTITVFDALRQVAGQLKTVDSNSQAAGQVMQQVFGRQGVTAGTNLAKAIETLNTNLAETKRQTGEVGEAYAELQTANEKLNKAIRDAFSYDGWDQMATGIKAKLVTALASVLDKLGQIRKWFDSFRPEATTQQTVNQANVDGMIRKLGNGQGQKAYDTYQKQLAELDEQINQKKFSIVAVGNKDAIDRSIKNRLQAELDGLLQVRADYVRRANELHEKGQKKIGETETKTNPIKPITDVPPVTRTPKTEQTEIQKNETEINKLTTEYQKLATAAKTADDAQKAGINDRLTAIKTEIGQLQERNNELKRFAAEAKGLSVKVDINSNIPELTRHLQDLRTDQNQALSTEEWQSYQHQIEQTSAQLDALKGQWKDGMQATFKLNAHETVVFQADNRDVLSKISEIQEAVGGISIDEKTLTVTADTAEAVAALQQVNELTPSDKTFVLATDTTSVLDQLREINGITVDDKTLTVTADTSEAYQQVRKLIGNIDGTTVSFDIKPKMQHGLSIQNDEGLNAYISDLKKQLQTADYGGALYQGLSQQLADTTMLQNLVKESLRAGLGTAMFDVADETGKDFWTRAMEGGVSDTDWIAIAEQINEKLKEAGAGKLSINVDSIQTDTGVGGKSEGKSEDKDKKGKSTADSNETGVKILSQMSSGISGIVSGMEQLGVEIPDGLKQVVGGIQAVTGILTTISTIVSAIEAFSAAGAIPFFAQGGIVPHAANGYYVPGNNYSGDTTPILANAGELILNKAAQGSIASMLSDGSRQSEGGAQPYVSGEQIYLGLNNYLRRTGRGELLTAR